MVAASSRHLFGEESGCKTPEIMGCSRRMPGRPAGPVAPRGDSTDGAPGPRPNLRPPAPGRSGPMPLHPTTEPPRMQRPSAIVALALILLSAPAARAAEADPPSLAGHWKGTLKLGAVALEYDVDFTRKGDGWAGDITIPAQGASDLPLEGVSLAGDQV